MAETATKKGKKIFSKTDPATGVQYTVGLKSRTDACSIIGLDVPPGVKSVLLGIDELGIEGIPKRDYFRSERVNMLDTKKSFPDVEELVVGKEMFEINIPNSLFPNVRRVVSNSKWYLDGRQFLARVTKRDDWDVGILGDGLYKEVKITNAFCLIDGEAISLEGVTAIRDGAFLGCGKASITDTGKVKKCGKEAFSREILEAYTKGGAAAVGTVFVKAWPGSLSIEIPDGTNCIVGDAFEGAAPEKLTIGKISTEAIKTLAAMMPKTVKGLEADCANESQVNAVREAAQGYRCGIKSISIPEGNERFKSIDGIVYSKDGTKVYACPRCKEGEARLADGAEEIMPGAFLSSGLESIILPEGLKTIEGNAFYGCRAKSITLPKSVEKVGPKSLLMMQEIRMQEPPTGLIGAALENDGDMWLMPPDECFEYDKRPMYDIFEIKGKRFAVPCVMRESRLTEFGDSFEKGEHWEGLLNIAYKYAFNDIGKQETAMAAYRINPQNAAARNYLSGAATDIMARYIRKGKIGPLVDFIRLGAGDISIGQFLDALDIAEGSGNGTARAYILAALEDKLRDGGEMEL